MRRNKRIKKHSRFATSSMGVASLIVSGFIMLMIFFSINSRCSSISREIGKKEKELQKLEAELTREKTRWDEMKVPERLSIALTKFGLAMSAPREDQMVRMTRAAGVEADEWRIQVGFDGVRLAARSFRAHSNHFCIPEAWQKWRSLASATVSGLSFPPCLAWRCVSDTALWRCI